jgi:hypothetical protein
MQIAKIVLLLSTVAALGYRCGEGAPHLSSTGTWGLIIIGLALLVMGAEED